MQNIIAKDKFVQLSSIHGVYALADHESGSASLNRKWILVEDRPFVDGENTVNLLVCNCPDGHAQRARLDLIDSLIENETLETFKNREEMQYCSHCVVAKALRCDGSGNNGNSALAEVISSSPFTAVANAGSEGFGIIFAGLNQFKCSTCKQKSCAHLDAFAQWNGGEDDVEESLSMAFSQIKLGRATKEQHFHCVSSLGIPWPVSDEYKMRKDSISQNGYPNKLMPTLVKTKCPHGRSYTLTQLRNDAQIQREGCVKQVELYHYVVQASCKCTVAYDGQSDLLLNLDNKNLFDLEWLFTILDRTNCSACPIMTAYKTAMLARSRSTSHGTLTYKQLRRAYNCFIR